MIYDIKKYLVGKTLEAIYFPNDEHIYLVADGVIHAVLAEGGCCSHSYFQHISGVNCVGGTILDIEEIDLSEVLGLDGDEHKAYGIKIKTSRGYLDIDMRNDSNGYYGGYLNTEKVSKLPVGAKPLVEDV